MKNKIVVLFILTLITFLGCSRGNEFSTNTNKKFHNGLSDINCSHLSNTQKDFASKLSDIHKQTYCKVFTNKQRDKCIYIYDHTQKTKIKNKTAIASISPDQAVESVIKANRQ